MKVIRLTNSNKKEVLKEFAKVLNSSGLVIYPTETCYGVAVDATNQKAVDKLLAYKTLRKDKPISVALYSKKEASKYVNLNKTALNIYDNFLPGPITVVSKGKGILAKGVESIYGTQGVRVSSHPFVLDFSKFYKKPFTATSANASYQKTPYSVRDILDNLSQKQKDLIDLIIDQGILPKRKPSTVVDTTLEGIHIVREGGIKLHKPIVYKSNSLKDTENLAKEICKKLEKYLGNKKVIFLLQGDLGAGKTHFAKYLAKYLKIRSNVVSPTFTLCNEYDGKVKNKKIKFYHLDTYRMYSEDEFEILNPKEIFSKNNVVLVEWANKLYDYLMNFTKGGIVVFVSIVAPKIDERVFNYQIKKK